MMLFIGLLAFLFVLFFTPRFAEVLKKKGIVGTDVNKKNKPKIPECGGLLVVFSLVIFYFIYILYSGQSQLLVNVLTILLLAFFGFADFFKKFSPEVKLLFPFLLGVGVGFIFWCNLLWIVIFALSLAIAVNLTNMLAGFNGLEAGLGTIASGGLSAIMLILAKDATLPLILFFSLLAFWFYNKYPARVFPGDCLTMTIGGVLTIVSFQNGLELFLFILLIPYALDAALKFASAGILKKSLYKPVILKKGKLFVPKVTYLSICRFILLKKPLSEKQLVERILLMEMLVGLIAILIAVVIR